jgi:alpha-glucuronidase
LDRGLLEDQYAGLLSSPIVIGRSPTMEVLRSELHRAFAAMEPDRSLKMVKQRWVGVLISKPQDDERVRAAGFAERVGTLDEEGFLIRNVPAGAQQRLVVTARTDLGLLYGTFHLLRLMQTGQTLTSIDLVSKPRIRLRLLNHWDNLDRSVERGYAGRSLWDWNALPKTIDPRYHDYARANASIGINGAVLNNVNANPEVLRPEYLSKIAAVAAIFRPYGIRVYLSVNFSSPLSSTFDIERNRKGGIGDLPTSDPLDPAVRAWWKRKADEIYARIPDFGGFLVKANSEGMPGPRDYGRSHAEGANMLAEALEPHGGIVMWRAFVYDAGIDADRTKRAYKEFVPLDGQFRPNVIIQAKNGPLDFQPREPVQPLFGAMKKTRTMLELQVTQEYLGHSTHLVYLAPMWKEAFSFDLYSDGPGTTLARIIDGSAGPAPQKGGTPSAIAGVSNIGDNRNWTGHLFAQANWYAYGRLAWDHTLSSASIAEEWVRSTLTDHEPAVGTIVGMMMGSWEACVLYMTPLGLHHIMQEGFHYGPQPDHATGREDWTSVYYHRADSSGLGYDRSSRGSNAVEQYDQPLQRQLDDLSTCPEKYLLWFHHVSWDHPLSSGRPMWSELVARYHDGVAYVERMIDTWDGLKDAVDPEVHAHVSTKLKTQRVDAGIWRDTCLEYFSTFSREPIPSPVHQR